MSEISNIINWENVHNNSSNFNKSNPFKFGFVEEFFDREFYEELYKSYPKIDDSWWTNNSIFKFQYGKNIFVPDDSAKSELVNREIEPMLGDAWKILGKYVQTEEFLDNFCKYSKIPNLKCKHFQFMGYKQGGFQSSHIHNIGPSTLQCMVYFSKGWENGDPGGTFMSKSEDEEDIIFEPCNLDNTMAIFHDGPNSWHGSRYIEKNVVRQAVAITLEGYSQETGWTGSEEAAIKNIHKMLIDEE
jgi:hypothetical protein|tara:strand:- start:361 stop:1092 length:732 start_codon:yes stop_codon:yes gene_type:complete